MKTDLSFLQSTDTPTRFIQQLQFILELDKLKDVIRRSKLMSVDRFENSAEHSWHLAMMAMVFAEYADEPIDILRVLKMLLVHDIVEIDAGDTYLYDAAGAVDKLAREQQAAARLFGLLPEEQATEFTALWEEYEAKETADARFANVMDRTMPLMHNFFAEGEMWQKNKVTVEQVEARGIPKPGGADQLRAVAQAFIAEAVNRGYLER